jgi:hypothetical protein
VPPSNWHRGGVAAAASAMGLENEGNPPTLPTEGMGMLAVMASGHLCGYEYTHDERVS